MLVLALGPANCEQLALEQTHRRARARDVAVPSFPVPEAHAHSSTQQHTHTVAYAHSRSTRSAELSECNERRELMGEAMGCRDATVRPELHTRVWARCEGEG